MRGRTPILPVAILAAAVVAIALQGDPAGLLLLTPALTVLLPLLAGTYPGEKSLKGLAAWLSSVRFPEVSGAPPLALSIAIRRSTLEGFTASNGSRGPPLPSLA
jgi:hypothetical protein